jgi:hypothetical protein
MAYDLFCKLHDLCYCSDTLTRTEVPPFGQIYALEYGLRVVQARTSHSQSDMFTSFVMVLTSAPYVDGFPLLEATKEGKSFGPCHARLQGDRTVR